MAYDANQLHFKEVFWPSSSIDATRRDGLAYELTEVTAEVCAAQQQAQLATIPFQLVHTIISDRSGTKNELLAIPQSCKTANTAKTTSAGSPLLARPKSCQP